MKRFLIVLVLIYGGSVTACNCNNYDPFDEALFKKYKYIAFVKVKTFAPFAIPALAKEERGYMNLARFTVDVLENYKAPLPDTLLMEGYKTSCDIGLRPDEVWVILANDFHSYATVSSCNYSFRYRAKNGKRDLVYGSDEKAVNSLRQVFGIKLDTKNGPVESLYPNGQKELSEFYKMGKLEGERQYWYPNGQLWGRETYVDGLKDGTAEQWFDDGHLERIGKYKAGVPIDSSQSWYESDTYLPSLRLLSDMNHISLDSAQHLYGGHQLLNSTMYDRQGHTLYSKSYYRTGRLRFETFNLPDKGIEYATYFRENGSVQHTALSEFVQSQRYGRTKQTLVEITYNEDGTQKGLYFDRKGRFIRRTLVKDGIEMILEEKRYSDGEK